MEKIKKNIILTIGFLTLLVLGIILTNSLYFNLVMTQKNIYKSYQQFQKIDLRNTETIFFGDSHPAMASNPMYVNNSFNYAMPSESIDETYYKIREIYSKRNNLKYIVLPYDLRNFEDYRHKKFMESWFWYNYLSLQELSDFTGKTKSELFIERRFTFIGKGVETSSLLLKKDRTQMIKGWQNITKVYNGKSEDPSGKKLKIVITPKYLDLYKRIIEMSENENVSVILLKYPLHPKHLERYNANEIEEYYNTLDNEFREYENVIIFDYQEFLMQDKYFSDDDHLNNIGAKKFSISINQEISSINR